MFGDTPKNFKQDDEIFKILVNLLKFQLFKMNTKLTSSKKENDNELNCSTILANDYKFL